MKPPPLPEETLRRVLRMAKFNGWSVVVIAGLGVLLSLAFGDLVGMTVGVAVAYGGWTEVTGRKQLVRGEVAGMERLVRAQWIVLGTIEVYCLKQLVSYDSATALDSLTPGMRSMLTEAGADMSAILPLVQLTFFLTYGTVAILTLLYQGGMVWYYRKRVDTVRQALADRLKPAVVVRAPVIKSGPDPEDLLT